MTKKKLAIVRTVKCWCSYDPAARQITWIRKYKYEVPEAPGRHVIQMKGYYIPVRK